MVWRSPELLQSAVVSPQTSADILSYCRLLFKIITGRRLLQEWECKEIIIAFEITSQEASLETNCKHKLQAPETNSPREHHRSWGTNANLETIELQRPAPETTSHRELHSSREQYKSKEHLVPGTCSSIETNKVHETISSRETAELTRPQAPQRPQSLRDQQPAGACFAPVRVVFCVGSTFLLGQHGPGAREVCELSTSFPQQRER